MQSIKSLTAVSYPSSDVNNLARRIEDNQKLIDSFKENQAFQNMLFMMRREAISDELLLDLFTGQASMERCLGHQSEKIRLLVLVKPVLSQVFGDPDKHHLSMQIVNPLSSLLKIGFFETVEKTRSKINTLKKAVDTGAEKINLAGADLRWIVLENADLQGADFRGADLWQARLCGADLQGADLRGANLRGANLGCTKLRGANLRGATSDNAEILLLIRKQEATEKYMLLSEAIKGMTFDEGNFPPELIHEIGKYLL
ncbi:MAG: pentapeptide repeat family protein [Solimicrobium sp.]|nr:pentapeptide repeat family protein [Solimicrobium sp.]